MGRILAIDYGTKRTGLAVTDPLKIIATPLTTVQTEELIEFLKNYFRSEDVEEVVLGEPKDLKGEKTHSSGEIEKFKQNFKKDFPEILISSVDERFTSKIAEQSMIMGNTKKKYRREKGNLDKTSAVIILQDYLLQKQL